MLGIPVAFEITVAGWVLLMVAAAIIGISKTALPGAATLSVAAFATVLPARTSTGAMLLLLIVGDALALLAYRRHADWAVLIRLFPAVIAGLVAGSVFLALADDNWARRGIGAILLIMIVIAVWRRIYRHTPQEPRTPRKAVTFSYGALGGFTTMVANAAGPVMSLYFLSLRIPVYTFLGTAAWFFAIVNVAKLPFLIHLDIVNLAVVKLDALLVPLVIAGALAGRWWAGRIDQRLFENIALALTAVGAIYLIVL